MSSVQNWYVFGEDTRDGHPIRTGVQAVSADEALHRAKIDYPDEHFHFTEAKLADEVCRAEIEEQVQEL